MSVADAQQRVSAREFSAWLALAELEPWGPLREDYRAAQIVAALATLLTRKRHEPREFMPWLDPVKPAQSLDQLIGQVQSLAAAGVLRKV
jgi:hypothetical protein